MQMTVVMPTVQDRAVSRIPTICQLDACGLHPTVVEQPVDWPLGRISRRLMQVLILRAGLKQKTEWILCVEDDIDIDPRARTRIEAIQQLNPCGPVSLWHTARFTPAHPGLISQPNNQSRWWGGVAMLFRAGQARQAIKILTESTSQSSGWEVLLRPLGILVTCPSLVEHRKLKRLATPRGPYVTSADYEGPDSHAILKNIWNWLPGRRQKSRVTIPYVAAAEIGITEYEAQWAFRALDLMHCIIENKSGWQRGKPIPWEQPDPAKILQDTLC